MVTTVGVASISLQRRRLGPRTHWDASGVRRHRPWSFHSLQAHAIDQNLLFVWLYSVSAVFIVLFSL